MLDKRHVKGRTRAALTSLAIVVTGWACGARSWAEPPDIVWASHEHTFVVNSVAFSPDGETLASASFDETIKLWRVSDGALLHTLRGHEAWVADVAFSPDGEVLASGGSDYTIKFWRVSDGTLIRTLTGHTDVVNSVAFAPDGQTLASGSTDHTAKIWRVSDGACLRTLTGHALHIRPVAFAPDGRTLATGSTDHTIKLWDVSAANPTEWQLLRTLTGHSYTVNSLSYARDGGTLASGSSDHTFRLWRVSDGALLLTRQTGDVTAVALSANGQTLALGTWNNTIEFWGVPGGILLKHYDPGTGLHIYDLTLSPDGMLFAYGSWDGQVVVARNPFPGNRRPTAGAGLDQTVDEGGLVTLNGSGSNDPDEDPLTYTWTQLAGPPVDLNLADPARPTFIAPQVPPGGATLTFQLVVNDGSMDSAPDTVDITVSNVNHAPVALAEDQPPVAEGSAVMLDGTHSYDPDAEDEFLAFSWVQIAGPTVTLTGADTAQPTFDAPFVGSGGETLTFQLIVNDGQLDSAPDTVNVIVENVNHAPVANAGDSQTRDECTLPPEECTPVELNGTASRDPDGDALTFQWVQIAGQQVTLSDNASPTPRFTAPEVIGVLSVELIFELAVDDGELASEPAVVRITVRDTNAPPACELAQPSVSELWPPNHKMHSIGIVGVTDPENADVQITILQVTQDEPVEGLGDGDTAPDAVIQGNTALIRAERAGGGNGRVYVIHFQADDGVGGLCTGSVRVYVPHSKGKNALPCVDDGQLYSSLGS